jgi:hypothetical protein
MCGRAAKRLNHGRLVSFFDVLRKKDFARPLSAGWSRRCAPR